jgi:hypothetical protein
VLPRTAVVFLRPLPIGSAIYPAGRRQPPQPAAVGARLPTVAGVSVSFSSGDDAKKAVGRIWGSRQPLSCCYLF